MVTIAGDLTITAALIEEFLAYCYDDEGNQTHPETLTIFLRWLRQTNTPKELTK